MVEGVSEGFGAEKRVLPRPQESSEPPVQLPNRRIQVIGLDHGDKIFEDGPMAEVEIISLGGRVDAIIPDGFPPPA